MRVLALLLLLACGPERKLLREDRREEAQVSELADVYWRSMRWGDAARAAGFVPEDERAAFQQWFTGWQKDERLTSVKLIEVRLGTKMEPPLSGRLREATVTLQTEGYHTSDQVLRSETITQRWYRDEHAWYVEWP